MNVNPNVTSATGSCGVNSSHLVLAAGPVSLVFIFTNVSLQGCVAPAVATATTLKSVYLEL